MGHLQTLEELLSQEKKVFLVVENIRSAYNVGAMFRTADGTGITAIILVGYTPTPENPKVAKTGLGAEFTVPWIHVETIQEVIAFCKKNNLPEYGVELHSKAENLFNAVVSFPLFIYVGNEVTGLSVELMTHLDRFLQIPMHGKKESLNVAEATSIALYELYRKAV